jgi:hypothetical protein
MPRKKKGTKKRKIKGLLTKGGALLMGVTPPAVSVVEAAAHAASPVIGDLPIGDKILIFATRTVNNLTAGFINKEVFPTIQLSGQAMPHTVGNGWGGNTPWLWTTFTGGLMVAVDKIIGMVTKSATRMGGVNITGN